MSDLEKRLTEAILATSHDEGVIAEVNANIIARALLPIIEQELAEAWDQGRAAERRDWEFTFDLVTPDEDRQPLPNPYRSEGANG